VKTSPLIIVFVTVFIDLLGFGIIIPLLPFYAETFGANAFTIAMLATSFSLMQFIFAPLWGRWSDRIGRRPIILMGLFGSFLSYLIFGLASSLELLFAARIFAGIAGANIPTAQAVVADVTTAENRAKGMGMIGAAFGLGFIFGPAIGGFLSRWGYAMPAFFASALSLANFCAAWFLLPETLKAEHRAKARVGRLESLRHAVTRPHLPLLLLVSFLVVGAFSGFETTFALFAERTFAFHAATIGYLFAFVGIILVIVQGVLVGRTVTFVGEHHIVPVSLGVVSIGLLMIPASSSVAVLMVSQAVLAVGMGFNNPSLMSLISQYSAAEDQGGILGLTQSLSSLGRIVGPLWAGFAFDNLGIAVPYVSSAGVIAVACLISLVSLWRARTDRSPGRAAAAGRAGGSH
jgi:multidrug resistance protein